LRQTRCALASAVSPFGPAAGILGNTGILEFYLR
jgi:hypothetical protein